MKIGLPYLTTSHIVSVAKIVCGIDGENEELTDKQIAEVCKLVAFGAPDTTHVNGKIMYGEIGISVMLSISLYEFPWFYQRYELWQRN
jgi:hypothetical protein